VVLLKPCGAPLLAKEQGSPVAIHSQATTSPQHAQVVIRLIITLALCSLFSGQDIPPGADSKGQ